MPAAEVDPDGASHTQGSRSWKALAQFGMRRTFTSTRMRSIVLRTRELIVERVGYDSRNHCSVFVARLPDRVTPPPPPREVTP